MQITYDPVARAVYVYVGEQRPAKTRSIGRDSLVLIDFDTQEHVCGIEILNVNEPPEIVAAGVRQAQQPSQQGGES